MKRVIIFLLLNLFLLGSLAHAGNGDLTVSGSIGVGTSSPAASAALDMTSYTKGFLPPRMTTAQRDAIPSPVAGLFLYNTTEKAFNYFDGTSWQSLVTTQGTYSSSTGYRVYTASGTFSVPSWVTRVSVEAWGGGGGGGGVASTTANGAAGGATSFGGYVSAPGGGGGGNGRYSGGAGGAAGAGNDLGFSGTAGTAGYTAYGEGGEMIPGAGSGGVNQLNLWGGSKGGNGGADSFVSAFGGGGGGGGAYVRTYASVTPGETVTVTVGAGGAAGAIGTGAIPGTPATAGTAGRLIVYW